MESMSESNDSETGIDFSQLAKKSSGVKRLKIYSSDSDDKNNVEGGELAKSKRGRKSTVPINILRSKIKEYENEILKNGVIVKVSESNVYQKIAENFENYNAEAAYQAAKRFYANKLQSLEETTDDEFESEWSGYDQFKLDPKKCQRVQVNITGSALFQNDDGTHKKIQDWAMSFRQIVFAMTQMPCAWSISKPRMAGNELTVNCKCLQNDCDAKLYAFTENGQSLLVINTTPFNDKMKHDKKNQIRGPEREKIQQMLKIDKAQVVAAKLANDYLRLGDIMPPYMPTTRALIQMKHRENEDLTFNDDPVISLREMKYHEPYQNCIGNVGLDPFDCSFSTPYQRELLRIQTNRRKIIISYDATGAPVSAPKYSSYDLDRGRYKSVFLYVIMFQSETGLNMPVYQLLTQRHDALNIRSLLDTWKDHCLGRKHPHEVITDDWAALLLANVKSFTNCNNMHEYDDKCYDALFLGKPAPATYIRLDRAHIIKAILNRFSSLDKNKKRFYTRIFGLLLLTENIDEAKFIITQMFIVLLNRYQYDISVTNAIKFLKEATDTHEVTSGMSDFPESMVNVEENEDTEERILKQSNKSKFFEWIQNILNGVKEKHVNANLNDSIERPPTEIDENPFYTENIENDWCLLLSRIHLWSNVMMKSFGSTNKVPTSACSESVFNTLKNVVFANEKRLRVDVFVRRYIDFLNGRSLETIVKQNTNEKVATCPYSSDQMKSKSSTKHTIRSERSDKTEKQYDSLSVENSNENAGALSTIDISGEIYAGEYLFRTNN